MQGLPKMALTPAVVGFWGCFFCRFSMIGRHFLTGSGPAAADRVAGGGRSFVAVAVADGKQENNNAGFTICSIGSRSGGSRKQIITMAAACPAVSL